MNRLSVVGLLFSVSLAGCTSQTVAIRRGYDQKQVHRVAVMGFQDSSSAPGSGQTVSSVFEKALLEEGFMVVERREIERLLEEQDFQKSAYVDETTARKIGEILGVDGLLLGSVNTFRGEYLAHVTLPEVETVSEPIYRTDYITQKIGESVGQVPIQVVDRYHTYEKVTTRTQTEYWPAEIGATVRMVDVSTGEVLWVGSHSEQGMNIQDAAEDLARRIIRGLRRAEARLARAR